MRAARAFNLGTVSFARLWKKPSSAVTQVRIPDFRRKAAIIAHIVVSEVYATVPTDSSGSASEIAGAGGLHKLGRG